MKKSYLFLVFGIVGCSFEDKPKISIDYKGSDVQQVRVEMHVYRTLDNKEQIQQMIDDLENLTRVLESAKEKTKKESPTPLPKAGEGISFTM